MKIFNRLLILSAVLLLFHFQSLPKATAATIRTGESVSVSESETNLRDLYLFGESITLDGPVENDLTTAGSTMTLNGDVTGSILAAGGEVYIRSHVGNTLRVAGGNVIISGPVQHDILAAGGNIRFTETASVSGDLLIAGGQIEINSPVTGNISVYGGDVRINSNVGGNIDGTIGNLTLGSKAVISGDIRYKSDKKATIAKGAVIQGKHEFKKIEKPQKERKGLVSIFTLGTLFKLFTDVVISILLIVFLPRLTKNCLERIVNAPAASAGAGFIFLFVWPLISILLLFFIWLGIASFLFYGLILLIGLFISKVLLGWWLLRWWEQRNKKEYILDWKAGVVGPIFSFLLFLIPFVGWLVFLIVYLFALGGTIQQIYSFIHTQKNQSVVQKKRK